MVRPDSLQDAVSVASFASLTETDEQGRFRLENISPGHYYIVAGRVDLPTYFPGKIEMKDGTDVLMTAGVALTGIDFALNDRSAGRMGGSPAPNGWQIPIRITVDDRGKLPIYSPNGVPKIRLTRISDGVVTDSRWDLSSIFIPLAPTSDFRVTLADIPDEYVLKSITSGSVDLKSNPLLLPPISTPAAAQINVVLPANANANTQLLTLLSSSISIIGGTPQQTSGISITLTKTSPTGPASGVIVTGKSNARIESIDISGKPGVLFSDSTFEFRGITAGKYNIIGHPAAGAATSPIAASILVGDRNLDGIELEEIIEKPLSPAEGTASVDRRVPGQIRLASIRGNVRDEISGRPVAKGRSTTGSVTVNDNSVPYTINDDGDFVIPHLLPGNYRINVFVFGYGSYTKMLTVGDVDVPVDILVHEIH